MRVKKRFADYSSELDVIELMAVTDLNQYLPEDILTKAGSHQHGREPGIACSVAGP